MAKYKQIKINLNQAQYEKLVAHCNDNSIKYLSSYFKNKFENEFKIIENNIEFIESKSFYKHIKVGLNKSDHKKIKSFCDEKNITIREYFRKLADAQFQKDKKKFDNDKSKVRQLNSIANNLNQLSKKINTATKKSDVSNTLLTMSITELHNISKLFDGLVE